eukprot:403334985
MKEHTPSFKQTENLEEAQEFSNKSNFLCKSFSREQSMKRKQLSLYLTKSDHLWKERQPLTEKKISNGISGFNESFSRKSSSSLSIKKPNQSLRFQPNPNHLSLKEQIVFQLQAQHSAQLPKMAQQTKQSGVYVSYKRGAQTSLKKQPFQAPQIIQNDSLVDQLRQQQSQKQKINEYKKSRNQNNYYSQQINKIKTQLNDSQDSTQKQKQEFYPNQTFSLKQMLEQDRGIKKVIDRCNQRQFASDQQINIQIQNSQNKSKSQKQDQDKYDPYTDQQRLLHSFLAFQEAQNKAFNKLLQNNMPNNDGNQNQQCQQAFPQYNFIESTPTQNRIYDSSQKEERLVFSLQKSQNKILNKDNSHSKSFKRYDTMQTISTEQLNSSDRNTVHENNLNAQNQVRNSWLREHKDVLNSSNQYILVNENRSAEKYSEVSNSERQNQLAMQILKEVDEKLSRSMTIQSNINMSSQKSQHTRYDSDNFVQPVIEVKLINEKLNNTKFLGQSSRDFKMPQIYKSIFETLNSSKDDNKNSFENTLKLQPQVQPLDVNFNPSDVHLESDNYKIDYDKFAQNQNLITKSRNPYHEYLPIYNTNTHQSNNLHMNHQNSNKLSFLRDSVSINYLSSNGTPMSDITNRDEQRKTYMSLEKAKQVIQEKKKQFLQGNNRQL